MPSLSADMQRLNAAGLTPFLAGLQRGIEKESLRIQPDGRISQQPHPAALGSALTHPQITTDFSEALLELITRPHTRIDAALDELDRIHRFVGAHLGEERLWAGSMPCRLGDDAHIPIAQYGRSNTARMKTLYRIGLSWRYGRRMQTIAGIHYNFSLPESFWPWYQRQRQHPGGWQQLRDDSYFGLIRNFRRRTWLLLYLFGASPALCKSFLADRPHRLEDLDGHSLGARWGTSLRMGDLGYQSAAQDNLYVCYNGLHGYLRSLHQALNTPHPAYTRIGVRVNGEYRQLRDTVLQIENEFYSSIRPKRVTRPGQTPSGALAEGGVQYIEVRCMDLNPFLPLGIDAETARFLDLFLLDCLFAPSPPTDAAEAGRLQRNHLHTVYDGRRPGFCLQTDTGERPLTDCAQALLQTLTPLADLMDQACGGRAYRASLQAQQQKLAQPELTPSARIIATLRREGRSYFNFCLRQSEQHTRHFHSRPLPPSVHAEFVQRSRDSLMHQQRIESTDTLAFDDFLAHYFAQ